MKWLGGVVGKVASNPVVWVLVVLLGALGAQTVRLRQAQAVALDEALARDSVEAVLDSTRELVGIMGDSARVWQRRALQARQDADALDRQLGQARQALVALEATVRPLDTTLVGVAVAAPDSTTRVARFQARQEPFTVLAVATLPRPPAQPTLALGIGLDPVPLRVRVGCADGPGLVRPANVTVEGPPWATVDLLFASTDPAVCNGRLLAPKRPPGWSLPLAGAAGGAGAAAVTGGSPWQVGAGAALGGLAGWVLNQLVGR